MRWKDESGIGRDDLDGVNASVHAVIVLVLLTATIEKMSNLNRSRVDGTRPVVLLLSAQRRRLFLLDDIMMYVGTSGI